MNISEGKWDVPLSYTGIELCFQYTCCSAIFNLASRSFGFTTSLILSGIGFPCFLKIAAKSCAKPSEYTSDSATFEETSVSTVGGVICPSAAPEGFSADVGANPP